MRYIIPLLIALSLLCACSAQQGTHSGNHAYTNALINESSPYLLQHAHNPVNWQPWGEAAFEKARKETNW